MGILFITWNFPPRRGGMEKLLAGLCHNLGKRHPVFVVTSFASAATKDADRIFRSPLPGLVPFFIYALWRASALLWKNPDLKIIFGGSGMVTPLVVLLAGVFRRKALVHLHGSDVIYPNAIYQLLCIRWLGRCDRVIANSHYTATLAEGKGVRTDAISVIPPGLDTGARVPIATADAKKQAGLEGRKVLLYVGRLARRKGVKEFIEQCLPKIVLEVPEACFVIVGDNPTESLIHHDDIMSEVEACVRHLGLEGYVRFLGWLGDEDLTKIYQASDLLVLPVLPMKEDVEGFGIVLIEAAAAGKPAVATRVGGIPDAIEDSKSGILVNAGDYELMSSTVVTLLKDDQARLAMGEYSRARVSERFRWEEVVKSYIEIFRFLAP